MLISFGELLVDMIKDENIFQAFPGGAPANFSVAIARLGIKPKLVASVGRDFFGDILLESIKEENVDVSGVKRSYKKTTLVFVELKKTIPEFVFYRSADTDISREDIDINIFDDVKWFHFGSLSLTDDPIRETLFHCLKIAKMYGITVSFSPNIRSDLFNKHPSKNLYEMFDDYLHQALEYVDVLIASKSEFDYMFGSASPKVVSKRYDIEKVIVTKGEKGCVSYSKGEETIKHPIFNVNTVDTTGAGDAFAAGFVYSCIKDKSSMESLTFASAIAALSTTKKGATSALPTISQVEEFLSK